MTAHTHRCGRCGSSFECAGTLRCGAGAVVCVAFDVNRQDLCHSCLERERVIPRAVRRQAVSMADATQQPHYIVLESGGSWLVTPEKRSDAASVVLPQAPRRRFGVLS